MIHLTCSWHAKSRITTLAMMRGRAARRRLSAADHASAADTDHSAGALGFERDGPLDRQPRSHGRVVIVGDAPGFRPPALARPAVVLAARLNLAGPANSRLGSGPALAPRAEALTALVVVVRALEAASEARAVPGAVVARDESAAVRPEVVMRPKFCVLGGAWPFAELAPTSPRMANIKLIRPRAFMADPIPPLVGRNHPMSLSQVRSRHSPS